MSVYTGQNYSLSVHLSTGLHWSYGYSGKDTSTEIRYSCRRCASARAAKTPNSICINSCIPFSDIGTLNGRAQHGSAARVKSQAIVRAYSVKALAFLVDKEMSLETNSDTVDLVTLKLLFAARVDM